MERQNAQEIKHVVNFFTFTYNPKITIMKKLLFILCLSIIPLFTYAQDVYTVDGESLELKTEVQGNITLLWNSIDGTFRYFIKHKNVITELKNTKLERKYQEDYKKILANATNDYEGYNTVKLTLPSLSNYINAYNASVDSNYNVSKKKSRLQSNLLIFGGVTNHPFVENQENANNPIFGLEIEFINSNTLKNHALFFGVNHALSSDKFDYSSTQFDFGYRYRFINKPSYNVYLNSTLATFTISKEVVVFQDENDMTIQDEISGNSLEAPINFGIGMDLKLSDFSFITVTYNDIFALSLKKKGNFSTYFNLGYKIIL